MNAENRETFDEMRPWLRSALAFLIYIRFGLGHEVAYPLADAFIEQLARDLP